MWEPLWVVHVWCMVRLVQSQCHKSNEAGGVLSNTECLELQLDIKELQIAEDILQCKSIITPEAPITVCLVKDVSTCLQLGGEFNPDQLEIFLSAEEAWKDFIFPTNLLASSNFCYLTVEGKPVINDWDTCVALIEAVELAIGIPNTFVKDRLAIIERKLSGIKDDLPSLSAVCLETPYLLNHKQNNLIIIKNLQKVNNKVTEIIDMVNLTPLESACGTFEFGVYSHEEIMCLKLELVRTRQKRSTLLNYFLGDGQRTDRIQNQVHDITKTINSNTQNLYQNQE